MIHFTRRGNPRSTKNVRIEKCQGAVLIAPHRTYVMYTNGAWHAIFAHHSNIITLLRRTSTTFSQHLAVDSHSQRVFGESFMYIASKSTKRAQLSPCARPFLCQYTCRNFQGSVRVKLLVHFCVVAVAFCLCCEENCLVCAQCTRPVIDYCSVITFASEFE